MKKVKHPFILRFIYFLAKRNYLSFIKDEHYLKIIYYLNRGEKLNLDDPVKFSEKIQWLKLYNRKPIYHSVVDKYTAREYVEKKIGEEILIPLIGIYDYFKEIDFDKLPPKFVLKTTHGSSQNIICTNKESLNIELAEKKFNNWFNVCLYKIFKEWAYKDIKPRIICEKYISDNDIPPNDYKFYCFDGQIEFIQVNQNRYSLNHLETFLSSSWEKIDMFYGVTSNSHDIEKPSRLNDMILIAKKLSEEFKFVRVDLYQVDNKIYFGELTLYPASGLDIIEPVELELLFGSKIKTNEC
ncbi:ATP-grasp fold amidoligase family protein [Morganella psychrotolerans]|uniref:Glycosyl transferase n=1 Tax=Morganella psychrotolerans TaxID=368603 RepID=A0A1B8HQV1_9GAMM|nr:ATP-grasp fold amidoligase family protein [Morganella psychrotolerans]OBU11871.1 hypothetical protein AYY18_18070 [Morganella psychrotolerans]